MRCASGLYSSGSTGLSRPSCFDSATTPTIVTQGALSWGRPNVMRLPTASSPRKYRFASVLVHDRDRRTIARVVVVDQPPRDQTPADRAEVVRA